jgi:hypothetical protein
LFVIACCVAIIGLSTYRFFVVKKNWKLPPFKLSWNKV